MAFMGKFNLTTLNEPLSPTEGFMKSIDELVLPQEGQPVLEVPTIPSIGINVTDRRMLEWTEATKTNGSNITESMILDWESINTTASNITEKLPFLVYSNTAEQIISICWISVVLISTVLSQGSVIVTIILSSSLHNTHFFIMCIYCLADLILLVTSCIGFLEQFIFAWIPLIRCQVMSDIAYIIMLGMTYHTGLIAFERYMYFCKPFVYIYTMTVKKVSVCLFLCYVIPIIMIGYTEITMGRVYHTCVLSCNLQDTGVQSSIQFIVVMLPSGIITIFSSTRIWKLFKASQVHPANLNGSAETNPTPVKQAKKGFRMILLVSGCFWGTVIPGYIVRIVVYNMGFGFEDLDTRRYLIPAVLMRAMTFLYSIVSSAANPWIHFYSRKDLRIAFCKLLKIKTETDDSVY